jgi:hypothetical protein
MNTEAQRKVKVGQVWTDGQDSWRITSIYVGSMNYEKYKMCSATSVNTGSKMSCFGYLDYNDCCGWPGWNLKTDCIDSECTEQITTSASLGIEEVLEIL